MNSQLIKTFLKLVKVGQLAGTALSFGVQPKVLVTRLNQLQQFLGVTLVRYQSIDTDITLTEAGQQFIPIARTYLKLQQDTDELKAAMHYDQLIITSSVDINTNVIVAHLKTIMKNDPFLRYQVRNAGKDEIYTNVRDEATDVGFSYEWEPYQDVILDPIGEDSLVVVTGQNAHYPHVVLMDELSRAVELYIPWSRDYEQWHAKHWDQSILPLLTTDSVIQLLNYLNLPNAWAIIPKTCLQTVVTETTNLRRLYLLEELPKLTLYAIKKKDRLSKRSLVDWFILQIQQMVNVPIRL